MSGVIIMAELAVECRIDELKNELAILIAATYSKLIKKIYPPIINAVST
jgi:hypothetical protein